MEWSIQHIAAASGVTSRTLRHYDQIGLLRPARVGENGYRYYDEASLVRLQRLLLLRGLGLSLPAIAQVLDGERSDEAALAAHLAQLETEAARVQAQIRSVGATIDALQKGDTLMPEKMFHGFDPEQYRDEVGERWGSETADRSAAWWKALGASGQHDFMALHQGLQDDYDAALRAGAAPDSARVQEIAERHVAWITAGWQGKRPTVAELMGLGEMYVTDPRFASHYTRADPRGAEFVRDALREFAQQDPAEGGVLAN